MRLNAAKAAWFPPRRGRQPGVDYAPAGAGDLPAALLHYPREAALRVRSHISPGPYRSFRELSLAGPVGSDIWCPPTFVGNSGIERFNGICGFALLFSLVAVGFCRTSHRGHTPRKRSTQYAAS